MSCCRSAAIRGISAIARSVSASLPCT
jgi:hypothetical protein